MIWAYLAAVTGVAAPFMPSWVKVPVLLACLICGAMYVRSMNRKVSGR